MIRVRQIKINIKDDSKEEIKAKIIKKLGIKGNDIRSISINKKSIDARDKNDIYYVYELDVDLKDENK